MKESSYLDYVSDERHMVAYGKYQARYVSVPRESDKVLVRLVREATETGRVLDIGCSTGNLLLHLGAAAPALELVGGDLARDVIDENRRNPVLAGIEFAVMDAVNLDSDRCFDVVIANATLCVLSDEEFNQALASIAGVLTPGGSLILFDWMHPSNQRLTITERSEAFPEGLTFHFRSYQHVADSLSSAGFVDPVFDPFHIPIDLEPSSDPADISTYTVRTDSGQRMSFRGTLFQPWCHLVAALAGEPVS